MLGTMEIVALAGVAVLLFGADKLPRLARSAGQAKKEFLRGQEDAQTPPVAAPPETPATSTVPENHTPTP